MDVFTGVDSCFGLEAHSNVESYAVLILKIGIRLVMLDDLETFLNKYEMDIVTIQELR